MALRTTPFHGCSENALVKRKAMPASKLALISSAALAALALTALILFTAFSPSKKVSKSVKLVQIGLAGDPVQFPDFQNLCLDACKHDPHKLDKCNAGHLSTFYLDYEGECRAKPGMCDLTRIRCGGPWRPENLT